LQKSKTLSKLNVAGRFFGRRVFERCRGLLERLLEGSRAGDYERLLGYMVGVSFVFLAEMRSDCDGDGGDTLLLS